MMTRRHLLAGALKGAGLLLGGLGLLAGCEGGDGGKESSQAQIDEKRKAELESQRKATEENIKAQQKKK